MKLFIKMFFEIHIYIFIMYSWKQESVINLSLSHRSIWTS